MTKFIGTLLTFFATLFIIGFIAGTFLMWLWNWLMPEIFGLPEITWLQALGLYYFAHLLSPVKTIKQND